MEAKKGIILDRRIRHFPVNPTLDFAKKMLKQSEGNQVVSIGGGSVIDVGKYVAFHLGVPHTAIPTTCGSGSEVTKYAVFIKDGKKWSMEDDRLIPDSFILDPAYLFTLPKAERINGMFDALSQSVESLWSPNTTEESRDYANYAIDIIRGYETASLEDLQFAAHLSGKAINITKTSVCHACSYPLTIRYGIPHGMACAMTLVKFTDEKWIKDFISNHLPSGNNIDWDYVAEEAMKSERAINHTKTITLDYVKERLHSNDS